MQTFDSFVSSILSNNIVQEKKKEEKKRVLIMVPGNLKFTSS